MNCIRTKFLSIFLLSVLLFSCTKNGDGLSTDHLEQKLLLDKENITLPVGDQIEIQANFGDDVTPKRGYKWTSSNEEVATVEIVDDWRATVTAKREGTTTITLESNDRALLASCRVEVIPESDGIIRILAIGNSFSEDALENHLHQLAEAGGIQVVIGNLYIGGASLELHWQNASGNLADYSYRKIRVDGTKATTANTSIATALADERWDYVSFQQASQYSGQYNTYVTPFPQLYNYVKQQLNRVGVKYIFHQTWAYAQDSDHSGFANYGNNQQTMYQAIISAVNQAVQLVDIDIVVPAGTAIQNGRTSVIGDNFCRDGYHLDLNIGRYTAAATWYEALFGKSVVGNTYKPAALSEYEAEIAQHAAHYAVQKPDEVTDMVDYKTWNNPGNPISAILIDFGLNSSSDGWNAFTEPRPPFTLANLKDEDGTSSGITIELIDRFNGDNLNGPLTTNTSLNMPEAVSSNSYFGNTKLYSNIIVEKSTLKLSGLDKTKKYNFCFFGSRMSVSDNRETSYTVSGQTEQTMLLNTSNNTENEACSAAIYPDAQGEISITVTAGPNNDNTSGFYYLTAMKIVIVE